MRAFRADAHGARLRQSAARLCLPVPPAELVAELIDLAVAANADLTPDTPGALYLRPTLLGTDVTIGAAAAPSATAILYVLACPVGEYLPPRPLTVAVETVTPRTTPQFGVVKTGANYAMALSPIAAAQGALRRRPGAVRAGRHGAGDGRVERPAARRRRRAHAGADRRLPARRDAGLAAARRRRRAAGASPSATVTVADVVEWIARPGAELALTRHRGGRGLRRHARRRRHRPARRHARARARAPTSCAPPSLAIQTGRTPAPW